MRYVHVRDVNPTWRRGDEGMDKNYPSLLAFHYDINEAAKSNYADSLKRAGLWSLGALVSFGLMYLSETPSTLCLSYSAALTSSAFSLGHFFDALTEKSFLKKGPNEIKRTVREIKDKNLKETVLKHLPEKEFADVRALLE